MRPNPTLASLTILCLGLASSPAAADEGRAVENSPLDSAVIYQDTVPKNIPLRVRVFSTENADLGTGAKKNKPKYRMIAEDMKEHAPRLLLESTIDGLREAGFVDVAELDTEGPMPAECLVIEGEFTRLNPGSQGKRYFVGFGAGRSQVCMTGRLVDAAGELLMKFDHCRHEAWGLMGGQSTGQMAKDSHASGVHLAEFMEQWAEGKFVG